LGIIKGEGGYIAFTKYDWLCQGFKDFQDSAVSDGVAVCQFKEFESEYQIAQVVCLFGV